MIRDDFTSDNGGNHYGERNKYEKIIRDWAFECLPAPVIKDLGPAVLYELLDRLIPPKTDIKPPKPDKPDKPPEVDPETVQPYKKKQGFSYGR